MLLQSLGIWGKIFMTRIKSVFSNGKAFIAFITAGDPDLDTTKDLILNMSRFGVDLIEIGIPFSDPIAEGTTIQKADERSLSAGTTLDKIFEMVVNVRKETQIPLAFMTYMNPVFAYGTDKFIKKCNECSIDAIIIPDLPFEEKREVLEYCNNQDIDLISIIAPTSKERIKMIASEATGFLYCISSLGVTGVRRHITADINTMISSVREVSDIPCAVGFGISTPEQAKIITKCSDGVIIGSAIVQIIEEYGKDCIKPVCDYIQKIKIAISEDVS